MDVSINGQSAMCRDGVSVGAMAVTAEDIALKIVRKGGALGAGKQWSPLEGFLDADCMWSRARLDSRTGAGPFGVRVGIYGLRSIAMPVILAVATVGDAAVVWYVWAMARRPSQTVVHIRLSLDSGLPSEVCEMRTAFL